ncbi:MAG: radical SAM family heme chaperone HemW [Clostridiaceae bacterium]|nr:radical SAM family heme chaperone HemW [Clostridiaceae bacterium]
MFGIYVHIPFCKRKCLYCDFPSFSNIFHLENDYVSALIYEIGTYDRICADTVYFGGGTPSSLSEDSILRVLDEIYKKFDIAGNAEITIEVNPGTATFEKLKKLKASGFNRISIGAQSFLDEELKRLGRIHNASEIYETVNWARLAGFGNISLDLMFGLPGQKADDFLYSLCEGIKLDVNHISAYSLILEEGTPFYEMDLDLPDEEDERRMYHLMAQRLKEAGFIHYEISNFAKEGFMSRHNMKYWLMEDYIGLGLGAHSFFGKTRYYNTLLLPEYLKHEGLKNVGEKLSDEDFKKERIWLGLRLIDGVSYFGEFPEITNKLINQGLVEIKEGNIKLTDKALDIANRVFMEYV